MQYEPSSRIAVLLLNTLRQFEPEPDKSRDDPAIASLERYVVRLMGELDAIKGDSDRHSAATPSPASPSPKILEILRSTIAQMDELSRNHPEIAGLKGNLIDAIAQLEESPPAVLQPPQPDHAVIPVSTSHPAGRDRGEPLPGEAGIPPPPKQVLAAEKEINLSKQPEAARDRLARRAGT